MTDESKGPPAISPVTRKRLQALFQRANGLMAKGDHEYAHELFSQCVIADPGNDGYAQTAVMNLLQMHEGKKKSMFGLKGLGSKGGVKKSALQKDWMGVIKSGLAVLKTNPWDTSTFLAMADACDNLEVDKTQVVYLTAALKFNPEDVHINRLCGKVFRERRDFGLAIACWQRVLKIKPDDEEASREVGQLAAEQTIAKGGYETATSSRDVAKKPTSAAGVQREELSPEEQLKRQIKKNPRDKAAYNELADIFMRTDNLVPAEEILARAVEEFPDDLDIKEKLEDVQMRVLRHAVSDAEKAFKVQESEDSKKRLLVARKRLAVKDLEHHEHLVERYPANLSFRFRLGQRYQKVGKPNEAIQHFQQARNDPKHHGVCQLELGKCFQQIKQYKLAGDHYANAIREIPDQDEENKKDALYHAGKLALGLKDYETAEQHLTGLAAMDFGYKDVAALLDKVAKNRED